MKLFVFDVEGTIFKTNYRIPHLELTSTVWHALAHALGSAALEEEIATHEKWENNDYNSYTEWLIDSIGMHMKYCLSQEAFEKIINSVDYNEGVIDFFELIDREKYIPVFISGGFQNLSQRAQIKLKVHHSFTACTYFFNEGLLSGYNLIPSDFNGKIDFVKLVCNEYGLSFDDWIFVGDGKNDVAIAKTAPLSFAINPHPDLLAVVDYEITSFMDLLAYIQ